MVLPAMMDRWIEGMNEWYVRRAAEENHSQVLVVRTICTVNQYNAEPAGNLNTHLTGKRTWQGVMNNS